MLAGCLVQNQTLKNNDGLSMLVQGILLGVYIQAVTVWGLAWIWVKINSKKHPY